MTPPLASSSRAPGDLRDRRAQLLVVHVVEQQARRAGRERLVDLAGIAHLDLERAGELGRGLARARDRLRDPAGGGDVVLLDQDRVVQPGAVVARAAGRDRRLLERAQPGGRLARVEHLRARALHRARRARRQRRDAREVREEVQRRALAASAARARGPRPTAPAPRPRATRPPAPAACDARVGVELRETRLARRRSP